jgi:tRNA A37 threonylcarbamoyladenosine dehydratase
MGGVGSWAAEALVRSNVGRVTLVDFDAVAITNSNRQMPATMSTIGQPKVDVMFDRLRSINPNTRIEARRLQISESSLPELMADPPDVVIDAIDQVRNKCHLLMYCIRNNIQVVSSAGAGGRTDPTQIRVSDLRDVAGDRLARWTRINLRKLYGFAPKRKFGIPVVHSLELAREPLALSYPEAEIGKKEMRERGLDPRPGEARNVIMGTACYVTSVFGMVAASAVVQLLLEAVSRHVQNHKKN